MGATKQPKTDSTAAFIPKLTKPHDLIRAAMGPPPKRDEFGDRFPDRHPQLDVRVSKQRRHLALAILDRLFKAIEARNWRVVVGAAEKSGTFAADGRDMAKLSISEEQRRVPHEPTSKELSDHDRWGSRIPKWDEEYTGELYLHPGGLIDLSSEAALKLLIDKSISDLEAELDQTRRSREAEEQRWREKFRREEAKRQERERVEAFQKGAEALRRYRDLTAYIEEVRRFGRVPDNQRQEGQSLDEWLEWAAWQAQRIHPLG